MKKIRGKIHYFGSWAKRVNGELVRIEGDGCDDALKEYQAQAVALHAGRTPVAQKGNELSVKQLGNLFWTSKVRLYEAQELSPRTLGEYREAVKLIGSAFGNETLVKSLTPDNFGRLRAAMSPPKKNWGPVRRSKFIGIVRSIFLYAFENKLIEEKVAFGSEFKKPKNKAKRKVENAKGTKLFTAQEVRDVLDGKLVEDESGKQVTVAGATNQKRAMILLGINAGLGNTDIGNLETTRHLDLETGWLDYPRPKTEEPRRAPLWKETVDAIKTAIAGRPKAETKKDAGCAFLNRAGRRMVQSHVGQDKDNEIHTSAQDYISTAFGKRLTLLQINGRERLNFYSLRHTFATIGLQTFDRDAVKAIMGQAENDMLSDYDETGPNDHRLRAIVSHVHSWLFG